ncbi:DUF7556 family protein [Natrinema halophilum]|uniref:Uncharacterized protein n=1 Tax=Natrinema halophilum TaxID=1699371 RepID=A0A7D5GGT9_9EURY|nr:hypothetical protein [Natrinema halophilum]QLG48534.1 hypothetical protein HYG82_06580 [Natrinema halophilum]
MAPEAKSAGRPLEASSDVVAAIDEIDGRSHLVIADIARDDAWIAMSTPGTVALNEYR